MGNFNTNKIIVDDLGVGKNDTFSELYPTLNFMFMNDEKIVWEDSRDGLVKERLDFKTIITNPYRRCVGGYDRNINVFFLLAEAMWIFTGRKDVKFLTFFNKRMADFSDDGQVFHAPYGFRLRHWGVRAEDKFLEENLHASQGYDQIADAIKIFSANPNTRQVVLQIWNPEFDLGTKTKDTPCNDTIMMKIRNGKLITTIQNRSNDLHWGLPTNVFQFSFLTEMIAGCLGIELGTQTHNSQSLHIYQKNPISERMYKAYLSQRNVENKYGELYALGAKERKVDFSFSHEVPGNRLREIDYFLNIIIDNLTAVAEGREVNREEIRALEDFSQYLFRAYTYLKVYLEYKHKIVEGDKVTAAEDALKLISIIDELEWSDWDVSYLAQNFFYTKLPYKKHKFLGTL